MKHLLIIVIINIFLNIYEAQSECGPKSAHRIVVDQSGNGDFRSVQAAIDSVPEFNNKWITILVKPGKYREKVTITKNKECIYLKGNGRRVTKITYDDHAQTDTSATFTSYPDNFLARFITFENSYNLGPGHGGQRVRQALAARIYGDKSAFFDCGFLGLQDTLWDVAKRHYFSRCYIQGAIDFIFGSGQSYYEECTLNATVSSLSESSYGVITAQGRNNKDDRGGFFFHRGTVFSSGPVYLGRAYGSHSRVIFQETNFLGSVVPVGWDAWNTNDVSKLTYSEVNCIGRGSNKSKRVPWEKDLSPADLYPFSIPKFIDQDGWIGRLPKSN